MPLRKARSYIQRANVPLPDRLESYNHYNEVEMTDCFTPAVAESIDRQNPYRLLRMHYEAAGTESSLDSMLHLDVRTTLSDDDLRKVEQTSALAGVAVRYPLLDEEVVAFSARIPPAMKLEGRRLRSFFKYAVRDFLPPATLTKSKHGFGLPFGLWLKTDAGMQALAYDSLASLKKRNIFQPAFLDSAIETHRNGHSSFYGELIWVLMLLELWFQKHRDRTRIASAA
jgi:asparagine synthase (glutamine-hydrolysing)